MSFTITIEGTGVALTVADARHEAEEFVRELVGRGCAIRSATLRHGPEANPQVVAIPIPREGQVTRRGRLVGSDDTEPPATRGTAAKMRANRRKEG